MSDPQNPYRYYGECTDVISGDTVRLRLDLGFETERRVTVRLKNLDVSGIDPADEPNNVDIKPIDFLAIWFDSALRRCTEDEWPLMVEVDRAPYNRGYEATIYRRNDLGEWADRTSLSSSFLTLYGEQYKSTVSV